MLIRRVGPAAIGHPNAWRRSDFSSKDDFAFDLAQRHVGALETAIAGVRRRGLAREAVAKADMPLPEIAAEIAAWRREISARRGFVLLRGFPVERWGEADSELAFWGLGLHFGRAVVQSPLGDRLGYVTDASRPGGKERGYRSAMELTPHTDSDDIVGLLCLRAARAGGLSRFISGYTLWNEIVAAHPEFIKPLMRGYHCHWFGEEPPGEPEISSYRIPIFSLAKGQLSICYLREFIDWGAKKRRYAHRAIDEAALGFFAALCERPDLRLEFRYEPGECCFWNNYTMLHARTAFEDDPEPTKKRLLLRLWLQAEPRRPVHSNLRRYYGSDGVAIQPHRTSTEYQGPAGHNRKGLAARGPRGLVQRLLRHVDR